MDLLERNGNAAEIMLDYVENNSTFQGEKTMRVPARAYTDQDQWEAELDLIFKRVPLLLAFSAELPNPGDYKASTVVGLPVLINRAKDGKARAFLNVCSHRAAPVAAEGTGNCSRFVCPYHGWTFGQDGKLLGVAEASKFGEIDKASHGLRELPCEERAGMIFASLTPGASFDLEKHLRGYLPDLESLGLESWSYLGSRVIEGANWKVAYDGYLEGYHFASLHPETIFPRTPSNTMHYEGFGPHFRIGFPQRRIKEALSEVPREDWGNQENNGYDYVRILFPNIAIFVAPEITQIAQLYPGDTPGTNRTVLNYLRQEAPRDEEDKAALDQMMDFFAGVTYGEDYVIGMEIQKGLESGAHDEVVFGKNERGNQYFHEWLNWYLAEDPTLPEPQM
ncbi:MAG: SRPBCC family protein [Sphingomonadaceae bacterium]